MICTPKVGFNNQQLRCRFFMGKYHTTEFKLQALQPILNGKMSIREATGFYNIPSNAYVAMEHFGGN